MGDIEKSNGGDVSSPLFLQERKEKMPAEYSFNALQTVASGANVQFSDSPRCCKKGYVIHRDNSGLFYLRGVTNQCKATYKVQFNANIAVSTGETVEPISVALSINSEPLGNATAIVTPAAVGDFFNVSVVTFIDVPACCCVTVSVANTSETSAIDVQNANIIIDRVS